jgi:hypothetical protein
VALAAHPGFANTNIGENSPALQHENPVRKWIQRQTSRLIPAAADAARPIIRAADDDDVPGGDYLGPGELLEIRGAPGKARVNPIATDTDLARRLWATSESMVGVRYLSDL